VGILRHIGLSWRGLRRGLRGMIIEVGVARCLPLDPVIENTWMMSLDGRTDMQRGRGASRFD